MCLQTEIWYRRVYIMKRIPYKQKSAKLTLDHTRVKRFHVYLYMTIYAIMHGYVKLHMTHSWLYMILHNLCLYMTMYNYISLYMVLYYDKSSCICRCKMMHDHLKLYINVYNFLLEFIRIKI